MSHTLRAPAEHGAVLIEPSPTQVSGLIDRANHFNLSNAKFEILTYREWRDLARRECLRIAKQHGDVPDVENAAVDSMPWFVAGHQPDLFHPGVWLKNFVLAALAKRHNGIAINLVVDNDTLRHRSIRVPIWNGPKSSPSDVHAATVPFDRALNEMPFEDAIVQDEATFSSFGSRIEEATQHWPGAPIGADYWREAQRVDSKLIGERFAVARRAIEQSWGVQNIEVSMSALASSPVFARFVHSILSELPRFHAIYNLRVLDYRVQHHIRSRYHPVPDLAIDGEFLETPFWAWRSGDPRRGRLFASVQNGKIELRTDLGPSTTIPRKQLVAEWSAIQSSVFKIRPRALTTTLFARLALSDVFVHGIGGAIYDTLTDAICSDFFGAPPPPFMIASGTMRLPLSIEIPPSIAWTTRELEWKPHQFLDKNNGASDLIEERRTLIAQQPTTRLTRRQRYHALRTNLERLSTFVAPAREHARKIEADAMASRRANAILSSRDYSFVLHSERELRRFFERAADSVTS